MINEWKLIEAPTEKNSERKQLCLKCDMRDVFLVVKELGKICSRPEKSKGEYNFIIYLSKVDDEVEEKLKEIAKDQGIDPLEDSVREVSADSMEKNPFLTSPGAPDMPNVQPPPVIDSDALTSDMGMQLFPSAMNDFGKGGSLPGVSPETMSAASIIPNGGMDSVFVDTSEPVDPYKDYVTTSESQPIAPNPEYEKLKQQSSRTEQPDMAVPPPPSPELSARAAAHAANLPKPPAPSVPNKPEMPNPEPEKHKENKPFSPFGSVKHRSGFVPAAHIRKHMDKSSSAPKDVISQPEETAPAKRDSKSILLKTRWSIELPLIPTQNVNTMLSGSHNRFAHAAAMAVVETPGTIYNPLTIYGNGLESPGKTHFVNLIAEGLSKSLGYENIFVTSGLRLSKGVDVAVQTGVINRMDELMSQYKAIIIDDVHLMMLTDTNKPYLSKWINNFLRDNRQVVLTTALPVNSLVNIEESLDFQLSQGWSVELKQPSNQNYKTILHQLMSGMDISINEGDMADYFLNRRMPFKEAFSYFYDVRKLEKFINPEESGITQGEIIEMLMGLHETPANLPTEEDLEMASSWKPSTESMWLKWGIMYPQGQERNAYYAMYSLYQEAQKLGMDIQWQQVFVKEYDPGNVTSAAFGMADFVASQNVNGVVVLGPQPATEAADKEAEFKHFVLNMFSDISVRAGWIPFERVKSPSVCTKALMDLIN